MKDKRRRSKKRASFVISLRKRGETEVENGMNGARRMKMKVMIG